MYYVKTMADNSGYANHRVICLVVIGSSFDSEPVFQVSNGILLIAFEKWTLTKNLTDPDADADAGVTTIARRLKVELKNYRPCILQESNIHYCHTWNVAIYFCVPSLVFVNNAFITKQCNIQIW